jgi:hypothetical protein
MVKNGGEEDGEENYIEAEAQNGQQVILTAEQVHELDGRLSALKMLFPAIDFRCN